MYKNCHKYQNLSKQNFKDGKAING